MQKLDAYGHCAQTRTFVLGSIKLTRENTPRLEIQWPDGFCEVLSIDWVEEVWQEGDQREGIKPLTVDTPYVQCVIRGVPINIPLRRFSKAAFVT
ncbi:hypothetical protein HQ571_03840 [Candidatus Kuenenbacteria bacterium]|nr:hypothetical protein [Candidatus Kuenenbacteria bacterium]